MFKSGVFSKDFQRGLPVEIPTLKDRVQRIVGYGSSRPARIVTNKEAPAPSKGNVITPTFGRRGK